jgi:hypothetical protein
VSQKAIPGRLAGLGMIGAQNGGDELSGNRLRLVFEKMSCGTINLV